MRSFGILGVLLVFGILSVTFADFSYLKYVTPAEAAQASVTNFTLMGDEYNLINIDAKPMFLIRKGETNELVTSRAEMMEILNQYALSRIGYSSEKLVELRNTMVAFNESLHTKYQYNTITLSFDDPLYDCPKQFGIYPTGNFQQCSSKQSCDTQFFAFCVARGCDPNLFGVPMYDYITYIRTLESEQDKYLRDVMQIDPEGGSFTDRVNIVLREVENINASLNKILKNKLRYPDTMNAIAECPDCLGACPIVPADKQALGNITTTLKKWMAGLLDTDSMIQMLESGARRVQRMDLEKLQEKLNGELAVYEQANNATETFNAAKELLGKVDIPELSNDYSKAASSKAAITSAVETGNESQFYINLDIYKINIARIASYNATAEYEKLNELEDLQTKITTGIVVLKYANSPDMEKHFWEYVNLQDSSTYPIKAENLEGIVTNHSRIYNDTKQSIMNIKNSPVTASASLLLVSSLKATQPIVENIAKPKSLDEIGSLVQISIYGISGGMLALGFSSLLFIAIIVWYAAVRKLAGKSMIIKAAYVLAVMFGLVLVEGGLTFGVFALQQQFAGSNIMAFNSAMMNANSMVVVTNSSAQEVHDCAIDLVYSIKPEGGLILDSDSCLNSSGDNVDLNLCIKALSSTDSATIILSENEEGSAVFNILPKPVANLAYSKDQYSYCIPKLIFRELEE